MKFFLLGVLAAVGCMAAGGAVFLYFGLLNFSADQQPSEFERGLAMSAVDASVARRSPPERSTPQSSEADLLEGMKLYKTNCSVCHGDPGTPERVLGKSFNPPVPQFMTEAADMPANQNFYIIKHGLRWTGMPAWGKTLKDGEIWKLTAFLAQMDKLPPAVDQEWKKGAGAPGKEAGSGEMKTMSH